jgi:thioredoxin-like negative regulator of GroEL
MTERLLLLGVAIALLACLVIAARWRARRVAERVKAADAESLWQTLGVQPDGRPTIVAFSTPSCAACHTAQLPALAHLQRRTGEHALRVLQVDAADQPHVARAFGVLTVPSTVVLSAEGGVLAVNNGFATADRLAAQAQTQAA